MIQPNHIDCESRVTRLAAEVSLAFSETEPPSELETAYGSDEPAGDYWQARNFFAGRHWTSIDQSTLLQSYPSGAASSISFLGQAGFLHYLPLFILCVLRDFDGSGLLVESLINRLTLPNHESRRFHYRDDFSRLNAKQCRAIAAFLEYLVDCRADFFLPSDDADQVIAPTAALQSFWSKYLQASRSGL